MPETRIAAEARTLYRLQGVAPDLGRLLEAFDPIELDARGVTLEPTMLGETEALFLHSAFLHDEASWCTDARATTRCTVSYDGKDSGALLVFAVDGHAYALCYGQGHRMIPEHLKDPRFGLCLAARQLDPAAVKNLVRRSLGASGRTDSTLIPGGAPLWMLGLDAGAEIVRSLGGAAGGELALTYAHHARRPMQLIGGAGLRTRYGLSGADLIADVREISRTLRDKAPADGLEAVDFVRPITDPAILSALEDDLEDRLARADPTGIVLVPPTEHLTGWDQARAMRLKIGTVARELTEATLEDLLQRTYVQRDGHRTQALKRGRIELYRDRRRQDKIAGISPYTCLETSTSLGSHRYHLMEGRWYEFDDAHIAARRALLGSLFRPTPSLCLPHWDRTVHRVEKDYNRHLGQQPGFLDLDTETIHSPVRRTGRLEICDQLGPDDTLLIVKNGESAKALSHQLWQGINAARTLIQSAASRAEFAELVARLGGRRTIPDDFTPKKIIFAILPARNAPLTPETLQPFAVIALTKAAEILHGLGIEVEVIGIGARDPR
jgi:uncharacterized protein (TIGR04141 family)